MDLLVTHGVPYDRLKVFGNDEDVSNLTMVADKPARSNTVISSAGYQEIAENNSCMNTLLILRIITGRGRFELCLLGHGD
jgi:hypothetical protein